MTRYNMGYGSWNYSMKLSHAMLQYRSGFRDGNVMVRIESHATDFELEVQLTFLWYG